MNMRALVLFGGVLILALFRLLPHEPNFTPIVAMAFFAGMYFRNIKFAMFLPLVALFISDLFLGFHSTMPFVYGSLILIALLQRYPISSSPWLNTAVGAPVAACVFFLVTNFGVWLAAGLYPLTAEGLMTSFAMGLPFFKNTLVSTVVYSFAAVATWELLQSKVKSLATA